MSVVGISPSDIVLLARYTSRVISALKEEGGAKSQYQEAVKSLEALTKVLQELRDLSLRNGESLFGDSVKLHAHDSVESISRFIKQISKYDKRLGSKAAPGWKKGLFKKTQWAMQAAGDLDNFRKMITQQLEILRLAITNDAQLRQRQATEDVNVQIRDLSSLASESTSHASGLNVAIADFRAKNGAATTRLERETKSLSTQANEIKCLNVDSNRQISKIPNLISIGRVQIETAIAKMEGGVAGTLVPISDGVEALQCELISTRNENKAMTDALDVKLTQILSALMISSAPPSTQFVELNTTMSPYSKMRAERSSLLGDRSHPNAEPERALEVRKNRHLHLSQPLLMSAFVDLLLKLCSNPMALSIWLGVQVFLAAPMSLLAGDHVWFEDALGQGQWVSLDCSQHLEIFEAYLRIHFRKKPGQDKVSRKEYKILLGNSSGLSIGEESWNKFVRPRSRLVMSMIMAANGNRCPKCEISLSTSEEKALRCYQCQQTYGKYIMEKPVEQGEPKEPLESIALFSVNVPGEQINGSPELTSITATDSSSAGSPPAIENGDAIYFKHMHLTLPNQKEAADVQQEPSAPDPVTDESESKANADDDSDYDGDVELQKGQMGFESDNEGGAITSRRDNDDEQLGNGALVNGLTPDAAQKMVTNRSHPTKKESPSHGHPVRTQVQMQTQTPTQLSLKKRRPFSISRLPSFTAATTEIIKRLTEIPPRPIPDSKK